MDGFPQNHLEKNYSEPIMKFINLLRLCYQQAVPDVAFHSSSRF